MADVSLVAKNRCRSNPNHTVAPAKTTRQKPNQSAGMRSRGHIQTAANIPGTIKANHIACTETSALVGGSQLPTSSKMCHKLGMETVFNNVAANTSEQTANTEMSNLRCTMPIELRVVRHR